MDLSLLTDRTSIGIGTGFYAAGLMYGSWSLCFRHRHSRIASYTFVLAGWMLQTFGLYLRGRQTHSCPLGNTFEILQFVAWSCTLLYLAVGPAFRTSVLGFFSATLATALGLGSLAVPAWDSVMRKPTFATSPLMELHAALGVFSYGVFGLLTLTSLLYLIQLRHLQRKRLTGWFSLLPSIVELDHMNLRLLGFGVTLLGVALAVGRLHWTGAPEVVHVSKLAATIAVFVAYGTVFLLRLRQRLVARPFAVVSVLLFVVTLASLWPVNASRRPSVPPGGTAVERAP